jgi:uncharacterized protein
MENKTSKRGFAGLDSMVSDITPGPELSAPPDPPETGTAPRVTEPPKIYTGSPNAGSGSGKWWAIAIALVVLFVWLVNSTRPATTYEALAPTPTAAAATPSTSEAPAPTPNATAVPPIYEAPAPTPKATAAPALYYSPPPGTVPSNSSNEESVPPIGNGLTLDRSQIRYCLSEKIRVEAWQRVNQNSEASVDAFNAAVEDYNARCSNFRYYTTDFESVRSEVEANRAALTQQGLSKAAGVNVSVTAEQNAPAIRASFDCEKARSDAEHLICNDAQLAAADVDLAKLFASAKAAVMDQDAFKEHAREQWDYRERSCHDRDCLVQWYASQRQWLTKIVDGQGVVSGPRNIDLSSLNDAERTSIESACNYDKNMNGPAAFNKCVSAKLAALVSGPRNIDLSSLNDAERTSIESACNYDKNMNGPAAYNRCLSSKLQQMSQ